MSRKPCTAAAVESQVGEGDRSVKAPATFTVSRVSSIVFIALIALACLSFSPAAQAAPIGFSIGVDFSSSRGTVAPADEIGVIPFPNWTTVTTASVLNLQDNSGNPTSLGVNITSSQGFLGQGNDAFTSSPHNKMMQDEIFRNASGTVSFTLTGIPYPGYLHYDLYIYVGTDVNNNRGGSVQVSASPTTYYYKGSNSYNTFVQATETGSFAAAGTANYILFENLTASSLTVTATVSFEQVFISGFQIVQYIPEPTSGLLLGLAGLAGLRRRRRD